MWFSFILTEKCDWDCNYCQFPLLKHTNEMDSKKITRHMPYIREIIEKTSEINPPSIEIQGGEVGLLDADTLAMFLDILGHKVYVSTNGMFLKKGYHLDERIRPYIREVQWHLTPHPKDFMLDVDYNDDNLFINKGIVHSDMDEIIAFIKHNHHITFNYVELECDINEKRTSDTDGLRGLYSKLKELSNVSDNVFDILERRFKDAYDKREKCSRYHMVTSINMANETIPLCQRASHINIPLSKSNLIARLVNFPVKVFDYPDSIMGCDSCIRLYSGKYDFNSNIRQAIKIRRIDFES